MAGSGGAPEPLLEAVKRLADDTSVPYDAIHSRAWRELKKLRGAVGHSTGYDGIALGTNHVDELCEGLTKWVHGKEMELKRLKLTTWASPSGKIYSAFAAAGPSDVPILISPAALPSAKAKSRAKALMLRQDRTAQDAELHNSAIRKRAKLANKLPSTAIVVSTASLLDELMRERARVLEELSSIEFKISVTPKLAKSEAVELRGRDGTVLCTTIRLCVVLEAQLLSAMSDLEDVLCRHKSRGGRELDTKHPNSFQSQLGYQSSSEDWRDGNRDRPAALYIDPIGEG